MNSYGDAYTQWQAAPEDWWREAARDIEWTVPPDVIFTADEGPYGRWFPGARLNIAANCLDRHVADGRSDQPALIWDSPVTGSHRTYSYAELTDRVARFAGALRDAGVVQGDRVLIYMPMVPEAVIAMLASARIGAVHSVVFGGFAPAELATRIADCAPAAIVTASCGIEPGRTIAYLPLLEEAVSLSGHTPRASFILQRPLLTAEAPGYIDFGDAIQADPAAPVAVDARAPLYILYTSGTTGTPKGIVRDCGGYAVALQRSMRMIYGVGAGDTVWTASDIGWVVGHSYIVYGPLLAGCTTVLYEGKPVRTPDAGAFWRICSQHRVRMLFTAPTAIRAIRQQDPDAVLARGHDLSTLETIFLAGERCDPATATWLMQMIARPVVDHWWQTETGWPITSGFREYDLVDLPIGSGGRAAPGWTVAALDERGDIQPPGASGDLAMRLPLPPGAATTLWGNDAGFVATYLADYPGWYRSGDGGVVDADGNVWVMGRIDDIINVAGHRLSTGAMEEIIASYPDVAECAVVGLADPIKGQVPVGLFVLKADSRLSPVAAADALVALVRERIGAVAALRRAIPVARLPKTRSGKILRKAIRQIGNEEDVVIPSTIEDASVIDEIRASFALPIDTRQS